MGLPVSPAQLEHPRLLMLLPGPEKDPQEAPQRQSHPGRGAVPTKPTERHQPQRENLGRSAANRVAVYPHSMPLSSAFPGGTSFLIELAPCNYLTVSGT